MTGSDRRTGEPVDLSDVHALILDLDGVLTDTAEVHFRAWKRMFDEYLESRRGEDARPFTREDYRTYVDGKPRYDGAGSFLDSRGIDLPRGAEEDPPDRETVCGLGNRKNRYFHQLLDEHGVDRIEPSIEWVARVRDAGVLLGVVTSSRNGRRIIEAAGIGELFEARVDGLDGQELGLPGKPAPDYFLEASRRLGVNPARAAIVEDAVAGVEAGARGPFLLVVGVATHEDADRLREAGADLVVRTLAELPEPGSERAPRSRGNEPRREDPVS